MTSKGEMTKQKILQNAIQLFSKQSFQHVTVRQIATAAGISPASIYKYYDTQEDLYVVAMKTATQQLLDQMQQVETVEQFVQTYIDYMFTSEVLFEMMTYFSIDQQQQHELPIAEDIEWMLGLLEQLIKSDKARIEAQLLFSMLNGLIISYKKVPGRPNAKNLEAIHKLAAYYLQQRSDIFK